ncbi:hypothetical protein GCM10028807_41430 [Spirosoma daeguense]
MRPSPTLRFFVLCLLASACNRVIDSQQTPVPADKLIPTSAIQALVARFPQAEMMVFTPLEKNQVWRVSFQQKTVPYQAVTNSQQLLVAFQTDKSAIPDSLQATLTNSVVEGGVLSNLRLQAYSPLTSPNDRVVLADYDWQNTRYTFRWTITNLSGQITYLTELLPELQLQFRTEALNDLPPLIQQSLAEQQVDFDNAQVQVDGQGKKRYSLTVRQNSSFYTLLYDDAGQLLGATNLSIAQRYTTVEQLPADIRAYLSRTPELANFTLGGQFSLLAKTTYRGLETYTVNLQKGRQAWLMTFNGQGQFVTRLYVNRV